MRHAISLAFSLVVTISGCAINPKTSDEFAAMHVKLAGDAAAKGSGGLMIDNLRSALVYPNGDVKARDFLAQTPRAKEVLKAYLSQLVNDVNEPSIATFAREKIAIAERGRLLSDRELADLLYRLRQTVTIGNLNGSLPFTLADNLNAFPELADPEQQRVIVDRTIARLQAPMRDRPIRSLMDYVNRSGGRDSSEGRRIESLLPSFHLRIHELGSVASIYPEFAARQRESMAFRAILQVKNADRLFADDVLAALKPRSEVVEWLGEGAAKGAMIVIDRVRNNERSLSERSETITYPNYDVDFLQAALRMPRNSSYQYDVVSGGGEIEYGYVVSARVDERTVDEKIVRGTVSGSYSRCQNQRIQNVFGGISKADFVANDHMRKTCFGTPTFSMAELRSDVISKIVDAVFSLAPMKAVVD